MTIRKGERRQVVGWVFACAAVLVVVALLVRRRTDAPGPPPPAALHRTPPEEAAGSEEAGSVARQGEDLAGLTRSELYDRARRLDIHGRSRMNKEELVEAIRRAGGRGAG